MVPAELTTRWEVAYRRYCTASKLAGASQVDDRDVAAAVASTSQDVAAAWRDLTAVPNLPWWVLAAVCAAAEAFESQAQDWSRRIPPPVTADDEGTAPLVLHQVR